MGSVNQSIPIVLPVSDLDKKRIEEVFKQEDISDLTLTHKGKGGDQVTISYPIRIILNCLNESSDKASTKSNLDIFNRLVKFFKLFFQIRGDGKKSLLVIVQLHQQPC